MDPETARLAGSPRALNSDAFFTADRSSTAVTRSVTQIKLDSKGNDVPGSGTIEMFDGFTNKHAVKSRSATNPLPHQRMLPKGGGIDPTIAGWKHDVSYTAFFSSAARALSGSKPDQPTLRVKLLFGTGSEYYRHGVCGAVENNADPTLLIVIPGIEPKYEIEFWNPAKPSEKKTLTANNRWGIGITVSTIESIISDQYGKLIPYSITMCGAFSTGYLGFHGTISKGLVPVDRLEVVAIYDCLYGTLKPTLDRIKALRSSCHIVAYVVSPGGNSFTSKPESFSTLALGGNPAWHYINLMGNPSYHAITSARLVDEARSTTARIIDTFPSGYEADLTGLVAKLASRNSVISDDAVFRKVKGSIPSGTTVLSVFAADKANGTAIRKFFSHVGVTRHCIGRARLLGWAAPPGEEWHDMLLIEFGWEYLT